MKVQAAAVTTLLSLLSLTSAFHTPSTHHVISRQPITTSSSRLSMSAEDDLDKLRATAAKAREDLARLQKESGSDVATKAAIAAAAGPTLKNLSLAEVQTISKSINFEAGDADSQIETLNGLIDSGDFSLWNSAVRRGATTSTSSMSKLVPFPVTLGTLESRTDGKVTASSMGIGEEDVKFEDFQDLTVAVVLGSTVAGIGSLAFLPENVGASLCYLFALIPIGFIAIGSTSPGIIAGAMVMSRNDKEDAETTRERICRHEAGHFLCGYMCGLPVKSYAINADTGVACVEFHTSSMSGGELTDDTIAALSVVAMSGSVAEIMAYDKAKGGDNDLLELENCFRKSKDFIGSAKQQDLTRWGALSSYTLIKSNMSKYKGLVQAFQDKKSLSECVAIIEGTA